MNMNYVDIKTAQLAYKKFGEGRINIIIEAALNSCSAEWWHIGEKLSSRAGAQYTVLVYDRAGYGTSSMSRLTRTPRNIAYELFKLMSKLDMDDQVVFIGHSQGGLYIQQFARLYPEIVKGVILIDPLSADDNVFKKLLTAEEYKKSGVDKLAAYRLGSMLTKLRLGFLFKPLLKKAPPFYYYPDFSKEAASYILSALARSKQYQTAIAEYMLAHEEENIKDLKTKGGFPEIPLLLITHTSKIAIEENIYFGGVTKEFAGKVEKIWQDVMQEYLSFSPQSKFIQAEKSSHYIHLTEFELIESAVAELMK